MSKPSARKRRKRIQAEAKAFALDCAAEIVIQAAEDGKPAKRPRFTINAYSGGSMRVSAFYFPAVLDLRGLRAGKRIPILLDHDSTQIVGQANEITINAAGVMLTGIVTGDDEVSEKVTSHARNGFQWSASVGVMPERVERVDAGIKVKVNGQQFTGPLNVVRAGRLGEVSFVAVGADEGASAKVAARAAETTKDISMDFDKWLEAWGFVAAELTEDQVASLQAKYNSETDAAETKTVEADAADGVDRLDPTAEMRVNAAAEVERIAAINAVCKEHGDTDGKIEAQAITEGWSPDKTELTALRASRGSGPPAIHSDAPSHVGADVIEAAACLAGGMAKPEDHFVEQTLDAADKRFRGRLGLQEMILEAAWNGGYTGRTFKSDPRGVLQAAFSTTSLSGILSNVANKFLLAGFSAVEESWRAIAAVRSVSDFKTVTSYRLTGGLEYQPVGPDGEIKHGTLGEASFTNRADTYGLMLALTRQDLINDDLGALTAVPQKLGRGAALKFNDVFWKLFINNSTFFTSGNNNFSSGTGTALGVDGLTEAEKLFLDQTDNDGLPLGVNPAILLTPNALTVAAATLMQSLELRQEGSTAKNTYVINNPHAGKFQTARSSYLANSKYTGYSAKAWYLLANPADLATIEVAFLDGRQQPTVESADADFNTLGIQMRGYHDFGVAMQETRAGVKMKGEA